MLVQFSSSEEWFPEIAVKARKRLTVHDSSCDYQYLKKSFILQAHPIQARSSFYISKAVNWVQSGKPPPPPPPLPPVLSK